MSFLEKRLRLYPKENDMTTVVGSGTGANYPIIAGALRGLECEGVDITQLISTSGSGLPMAFMAAGESMTEFLHVARAVLPKDIIKYRHFGSLFSPGVFTLTPVLKLLRKYGPKSFDACKVPHRVVSFDTDTRERVVFGSNDVRAPYAEAVQSSMSMPWIMSPVNVGNRRCSDGGTVDNFALDLVDEPSIGIRVIGAKDACRAKPWSWWGGYSAAHIDGIIRARENNHIATKLWKKHRIITIKSPMSSLDFWELTPQKVEMLFLLGYNAVIESR